MGLAAEMIAHANDAAPNEACGLVVAAGPKTRLVRAKNIAAEPRSTFDLDPDAWLEVGDGEDVIGIYHSHPVTSAEPSLADMAGCEASKLPWYIVTPSGGYRLIEPSGFEAPYLERPYVYGVHDCWSLVRDWYNREWKLDLPDFARPPLPSSDWPVSPYLANFEGCGFVPAPTDEAKLGDMFLLQVGSRVSNHIAVYLGDGTILHHVQGRLSKRDPWGGYWHKHMTHHLRHNTRLEA